ncbi:small nucleolar ribonucleoprotein complex subunit [Cordyceps fumosorosea ARSEF 2679]|uniref:U three protein 7 n=1 Tax=Cordyceps fumosorosea (strain ARSEF 2679) TaxID=1081104 RepID=A0A168B4P4_CORFA|nr:small nucleolar ribonucleoprotein complex subunit [Cordyceps fumosorosea ARSEF 2679]OAA69615.1 small nucleolar ribonucleoprotein complex subunit [Cordyceps fumosorosea ARSEF 2679]
MSTDVVAEASATVRDNGAVAVTTAAKTDLIPRHEKERMKRLREAKKAYGRGKAIDTKNIRDKKLRANMKQLEGKYHEAAVKAKDAEILLEHTSGFLEAEGEMEKTYKVRQEDILPEVAMETATKRFELKLDALGPYVFDYSRNGRELLLGGRKGHVATMDWREGQLGCEIQLGETVRDVKWLHNNQFFAAAQKKYVYIYDRNGVELHCLRKHVEPTHMEFLPYHFLLATIGNGGVMRYQDTSTGQLVAEIPTKLGQPVSLGQNRYNAIMHVGHQNGAVTLWSPNSQEPLVKLLAHRGPVRSLAMDRVGRYMVSTGQDQRMAVWDIRMFKEVNSYFTRQPASSVAISDTGLTAVGWGTQTTIWKGLFASNAAVQQKVESPYMAWGGEGRRVERVQWCPFEDVLGLGHDQGFSSIIVPGAGEANFDALEANPFETKKQRQEGEVKGLLNKLAPEMIALDPNFVGQLDLRSEAQRKADRDLDAPATDIAEEIRNRARGKNGALKKYLRKQRKKNIIDEKRMRIDEMWNEQQKQKDKKRQEEEQDLGPALARFARRE